MVHYLPPVRNVLDKTEWYNQGRLANHTYIELLVFLCRSWGCTISKPIGLTSQFLPLSEPMILPMDVTHDPVTAKEFVECLVISLSGVSRIIQETKASQRLELSSESHCPALPHSSRTWGLPVFCCATGDNTLTTHSNNHILSIKHPKTKSAYHLYLIRDKIKKHK